MLSCLAAAWRVLNRIKSDVLPGEGRVDGGELHKLEPRELSNVPTRVLGEFFSRSAPRVWEQCGGDCAAPDGAGRGDYRLADSAACGERHPARAGFSILSTTVSAERACPSRRGAGFPGSERASCDGRGTVRVLGNCGGFDVDAARD